MHTTLGGSLMDSSSQAFGERDESPARHQDAVGCFSNSYIGDLGVGCTPKDLPVEVADGGRCIPTVSVKVAPCQPGGIFLPLFGRCGSGEERGHYPLRCPSLKGGRLASSVSFITSWRASQQEAERALGGERLITSQGRPNRGGQSGEQVTPVPTLRGQGP